MAQYITKVIDPVIKGTTFKGIGFNISIGESVDSLSPLLIASAKMELRLCENAPVSLSLTDGAGLTLDEASPGLVVVDKQIIDIDAADYIYEIETTTTDGDINIYIKGTWEIIN